MIGKELPDGPVVQDRLKDGEVAQVLIGELLSHLDEDPWAALRSFASEASRLIAVQVRPVQLFGKRPFVPVSDSRVRTAGSTSWRFSTAS